MTFLSLTEFINKTINRLPQGKHPTQEPWAVIAGAAAIWISPSLTWNFGWLQPRGAKMWHGIENTMAHLAQGQAYLMPQADITLGSAQMWWGLMFLLIVTTIVTHRLSQWVPFLTGVFATLLFWSTYASSFHENTTALNPILGPGALLFMMGTVGLIWGAGVTFKTPKT